MIPNKSKSQEEHYSVVSYKCINCNLMVEFKCGEAPKCKRCDGKVFSQLRDKKK